MTTYDQLTPKQKTRYERILHLAENLVYQQGFYKLSLEELTKRLRVSRSTIYENFGSKEGLIEKIVERYDERLNSGLREIVNDDVMSTYDKFIAVSHQLAKSLEGKANYKFHHDLKIHAPHLYDKYVAGRERRVAYCYRPLVEQGVREGLFDKSLPTDFILQTYLKSSQIVCETNLLENSSVSKTEAMDIITRIFLNGAKNLNP